MENIKYLGFSFLYEVGGPDEEEDGGAEGRRAVLNFGRGL